MSSPGNHTGADGAAGFTFTVTGIASPVPEPASVALFAVGATGLLRRRGRARIGGRAGE